MAFKSFYGLSLFFIFILLNLQEYVTQANQVIENNMAAAEARFVMASESNLNCGKEILCEIGGRKMVAGERKLERKEGKNANFVKNMKDLKVKIDDFMVFSADYRTPKPHPPKNN